MRDGAVVDGSTPSITACAACESAPKRRDAIAGNSVAGNSVATCFDGVEPSKQVR